MTTLVSPYNFATGATNVFNLVTDFGGSMGAWNAVQGEGSNRLHRSRDFTGRSIWNFYQCSGEVLAATAPDGSETACIFHEGSLSGCLISGIAFGKAATAQQYTASVFAKAKERTRIAVAAGRFNGDHGFRAGFDLVGGQVAYTTSVSSGVFQDAGMEDAGGGWWECWVTGLTGTDTTVRHDTYMDGGSGLAAETLNYSQDGSSAVYVWGAKLALGTYSTYLNSPYDEGGPSYKTLIIPAGSYATAVLASSYPGATLQGAGAATTTLTGQLGWGSIGYCGENGTGEGTTGTPTVPRIATVNSGGTEVTLLDPTNRLRNFYVGQPVMLLAYDLQGFGFPQNNHIFEYNRITAIDVDTGVITLETPIVYDNYRSTYPIIYQGDNNIPDGCGSASLMDMSHNWDMHMIVKDITIDAPDLLQGSFIRSALFENVDFPNGQVIPSESGTYVFRNCYIPGFIEVDKMVDTLWYDGCNSTPSGFLQVQSSSVNLLKVTDCTLASLSGTAKSLEIADSTIGNLGLGPSAYGQSTGTTTIDNTVVTSLSSFNGRRVPTGDMTAAFADGDFTFDASGGLGDILLDWIPGGITILSDLGGTTFKCFRINDVTRSGVNIIYHTDLPDPCPHLALSTWTNVVSCVDFTVTNCPTGALRYFTDSVEGANRPTGCYWKAVVTENDFSGSFPYINSLFPQNQGIGYLEKIIVNVTRAYTGVRPALTLGVMSNGFSDRTVYFDDATSASFGVSVNLKTAGQRVWTSGSATGAGAGDSGVLWTGDKVWLDRIAVGAIFQGQITSEAAGLRPEFTVEIILNMDS